MLEKEILLRIKEVDVVVCREGEETAVEFASSYEKGFSLSRVRGICFRRDKQIIETPQRNFIQNLDSIPFPARHLLPMKYYMRARPRCFLAESRIRSFLTRLLQRQC